MYTIKEASARSGVGIPLLRAWERRYGVVVPTRTASGYRLYDDGAIDRLRAMRHLIATGWSAQQAAEHVRSASDAELAALSSDGREAHSPHDARAEAAELSTSEELVARLVAAARVIDADDLEAALDEAFASGRFEVVAQGIVMPALRAIGDAWERGDVSVAGEHAASHAVLRRLAMAYEAAGDPVPERPILVGLGSGGRHELGALAFATAARRAGLPVLYLGPDLPPESWITAAERRSAVAAIVGVPTRADIARARAVLDALRAGGSGLLLAVGGEEAGRLAGTDGVIHLPRDLVAAVATLRAAVADARGG
jgi:DNA-binding transcriptional MerR regulator/methylmalonyl-CoA mutase cobalamin-binding subunit